MVISSKIIKYFTTTGFRNSIKQLLKEFKICCIHNYNRYLAISYKYHTDIHLHLGCGKKYKDGFVNIDMFAKNADLHLDLREPLPFQDNSVSVIESEHFFEHLSYPSEVQLSLKECMRVIKPGGLFSVGVPDAEPSLIAYVHGDEKLFLDARRRFHPTWCTTPMHQINYLFRQGNEHKYAWDFQTLKEVLIQFGFIDIHRRSWDRKRDSQERKIRTLYIDAHTPMI